VSFDVPSQSEFAAPTGTTTKTVTVGGGHASPGSAPSAKPSATQPTAGKPTVSGAPWAEVLTVPSTQLPSKQLSEATTAVSGAWGSGRLLHTNLFNVLVLPDGRALAGFVTPATLEAAVAPAPG
jgi:hypothetical protein